MSFSGVTLPAVLRGRSAAMRQQLQQLAAASRSDAPVLIVAEPGLDPADVAGLLHEFRRPHPFEALNCADLPADTLTERLFGRPEPSGRHRRDLDVADRRSILVSAGRGTVFLANITEMGAAIQRRLARVLRDGELYVDTRSHPVCLAARIVASAPPEIVDDVESGRVLRSLYTRLASCQVSLAPLSKRPEDVPDIVKALAEELAARRGEPARTFTPAALTALASLSWPRNLDELRGVLERLCDQTTAPAVRQEEVLRALGFGQARRPLAAPAFDNLRDARLRFEREYIAAVLERHGWRMAEAAATLGIERANLYRKIRQLRLPRPHHGAAGEY